MKSQWRVGILHFGYLSCMFPKFLIQSRAGVCHHLAQHKIGTVQLVFLFSIPLTDRTTTAGHTSPPTSSSFPLQSLTSVSVRRPQSHSVPRVPVRGVPVLFRAGGKGYPGKSGGGISTHSTIVTRLQPYLPSSHHHQPDLIPPRILSNS